jgi:hypothetical protein
MENLDMSRICSEGDDKGSCAFQECYNNIPRHKKIANKMQHLIYLILCPL